MVVRFIFDLSLPASSRVDSGRDLSIQYLFSNSVRSFCCLYIILTFRYVIPAQAGIYVVTYRKQLDSRLRGNDVLKS